MTNAKKLVSFLRKRKYLFVFLVVIFFLFLFLFIKNGRNPEQTILLSRADFVNSVSVSGKVVAAEDVELSFERGGAIEKIYYEVGQKVSIGSLIAKVDAKDAEKALHDAEISLESARLELRKSEIENSDTNLNTDLLKSYDDGFTEVSESLNDFLPVLDGVESLLSESLLSSSAARSNGITASNYRDEAEDLYYQSEKLFDANKKDFRTLTRDSSAPELEKIINDTYETAKSLSDTIKAMKNFVDYLAEDQSSDYLVFKETLLEYSDTVNQDFSELLSSKISIQNYKDAFTSTEVENEDLLLAVRQRENSLQTARKELEDYFIRAPFDGMITKIDAKIGEVATANQPIISLISSGIFQIESYVPEVNIAQIKVGDAASVTLDAYGEDVVFYAKVVSVDPAETVKDGVSTYKTKLQFDNEDTRIKSGMTANVLITTFSKPDAIVIPGGVVFEKDGEKFVQVKVGEEITDRKVILGEYSSLNQVEVISGLTDGEMVILNPK